MARNSNRSKDDKSWLLYELNSGIPVQCERDDWKSCPEHKHLSLTPDFDGFSVGEEDGMESELHDDPNDNIVSINEYEGTPKIKTVTESFGKWEVSKGNVDYVGKTEYALDSKVYDEAKENVESRFLTPSMKIGLGRTAYILGGFGGAAGLSVAASALFGPLAMIAPIALGIGALAFGAYKAPQYTGDINAQDYMKEKEYLKEYMKLKGLTDESQLEKVYEYNSSDYEGTGIKAPVDPNHECYLPSRGSRWTCKECGKSYHTDTAGEGGIRSWYEDKKQEGHACNTPTSMFKKAGYIHTCKECDARWELSFKEGVGEMGGTTTVWTELA